MLNIVADINTPLIGSAFRGMGELTLVETGKFSPAAVSRADVLIVRSETKVDEQLLRNSSVHFVGTVTIGTDHIDTAYLQSRGIGFASAPGSNANSVKEYVLAAMLDLGERFGFSLEGKTLGVVGVGNIGGRVAPMAEALGMKVLLDDPPLARKTGDPRYLPLDALMGADILTVHVPLTQSGQDPTYHLFDGGRIARMKKGTFLINSSRGAVVEGAGLLAALQLARIGGAVLDVWEDEPNILWDLLNFVNRGTPHIAGYSLDGKVNAVVMIREAVSREFGLRDPWDSGLEIPAPPDPILVPNGQTTDEVLRSLVRRCYDIAEDDRGLRAVGAESEALGFSRLRKQYRVRREFHNYNVRIAGLSDRMVSMIGAAGFGLHRP